VSKTIWIINEYAGTPNYGMEYRHYYIGKELVNVGYKVNIVSSNYSHLFSQLPKKSNEKIDGINYLWLKTLNYGNSHNKWRALKWIIFSLKVFTLPFKLSSPDVILVSPMAPFPIIPAWFLSKIYGAKLIYEVKDIWPMTLVELGGFSRNNSLIKLMGLVEKIAIKKSDVIVSNLSNYGEHIKKDLEIDRGFEWISNGVDLNELKEAEALSEDIEIKIPKGNFIVGYLGTVGVANALEYFCQSAEYLADKKDISFVIVGNGQEKSDLMSKFDHLDNLIFIDAIPKKQVQSMLTLFDVCYLGWRNESLYKYGTSANKIFDYMYSKRPILNSFNGGGDLVKISNSGICVESENLESIISGVLEFYKMPKEEVLRMGGNGRRYVVENFTYQKLSQKLEKLF